MTFVMARGDNAPSIAMADTLKTDSLKLDTTQLDSLQLAIRAYNKAVDDSIAADSINRAKKNGIDAPVDYVANDSMVYYANSKKAFLYGKSNVKYENMDLSAANINMSLDSSVVHATGAMDTVKKQRYGLPVFLMGEDKYETDTMAFNFKSKRGLIQNAYTHQEDGFLLSERSKRDSEGNFYLKRGRYTTCDDPHPDFYIALTRAKVRPGKDVVFGPAYLVVQDVPLPLAIPYGFFPFTKNYSSGVIMPTYGDEMDRGFYLRDGGYYFAISDKMDLKLLGEIFTKGSWGVSAASNYNVRYKYNGQFFASYQDSRYGDEGIDQRKEKSFKIQWTHRQDAKANPYSTLSASVNFSSISYENNNLTSMYNPTLRTQSTRTSSVSWGTTMSSIGLSLTSQASMAQNMRDSTIEMTLPDLNIYLTQFYPFKRKHAVGRQRWYEKINVAYTGRISNTIHTKESQLFHSSFSRDWRNGWSHSIPVKANFMVAKYLSITPSFNFTDRMYTQKIARSWDVENQKEVLDTIQGFTNVYDWNAAVTMNTKIYGFFVPNRKIFGEKIIALRHVFTPTLSFSYAPDFSAERYGYYDTYIKTDSKGEQTPVKYSYYANSLFGGPGPGRTGRVSLTLDNNIEMKIRSDKDSTGIRKISVIDRLAATMSYNMAAKERPWSDLVIDLRLKWWKNYTFTMNAVFATYAYELDNNGKPYVGTHTEWSRGRFGRFQGLSQTFNYTINPEKIRKLFGGKNKRKDDEKSDDNKPVDTGVESNVDPNMMAAQKKAEEGGGKMAETDDDGYLKFSMPWSLTISYGINMRENTAGTFNKETMRYPYKFTHNLNFYGFISIANGWNIAVNSGYDFEYHKLSLTTASLARDLHCFSMACSVVLAPYTSYNFSFKCNASTLTDALKYDKRSSYSNSVKWY